MKVQGVVHLVMEELELRELGQIDEALGPTSGRIGFWSALCEVKM